MSAWTIVIWCSLTSHHLINHLTDQWSRCRCWNDASLRRRLSSFTSVHLHIWLSVNRSVFGHIWISSEAEMKSVNGAKAARLAKPVSVTTSLWLRRAFWREASSVFKLTVSLTTARGKQETQSFGRRSQPQLVYVIINQSSSSSSSSSSLLCML